MGQLEYCVMPDRNITFFLGVGVEAERDQSAEVMLLLFCVCLQGQWVAVEEEQLLATGSPPREWGKKINVFCIVNL